MREAWPTWVLRSIIFMPAPSLLSIDAWSPRVSEHLEDRELRAAQWIQQIWSCSAQPKRQRTAARWENASRSKMA